MIEAEMLQLAATAYFGPDGFEWNSCSGCIEYIPESSQDYSKWSPLTDDGDALRLAVDLGLQVFPIARTTSGQACSAVADCCGRRLADVVATTDLRADTRRAIVRAAAETVNRK